MLLDINTILKTGGYLVVSERVAFKSGKKRRDCNHIMPLKEDLIQEFPEARLCLSFSKDFLKKAGITFHVLKNFLGSYK